MQQIPSVKKTMSSSVAEDGIFVMATVRNLQQYGNAQDTGGSQFNAAIFWSINALWIALVICLSIWIWKFQGALRLANWSQSFSSQDNEQRNGGIEQQVVPPEKRRKLLSDYFRNSKVHMVSDSYLYYMTHDST